MQTDRYTRVMLTVIALALVWICLRDTAPPAFAAGGQVRDRRQPVTKVQIVSIDESPSLRWESLPVTVR